MGTGTHKSSLKPPESLAPQAPFLYSPAHEALVTPGGRARMLL